MKDGPPRLPLRPEILFYFCKKRKRPTLAKVRECCAARGCKHLGAAPKKDFGESEEEEEWSYKKPRRKKRN